MHWTETQLVGFAMAAIRRGTDPHDALRHHVSDAQARQELIELAEIELELEHY